jgi:nucleotide-binding universal stress UspA family protein
MAGTMVIATDGSRSANNAVILGGQLAAKCDAEVVVVHVLQEHVSAMVARELVAIERLPGNARQEIERLEDVERKVGAFVESVSPTMWVSRETMEVIGNLILDDAQTLAESRGATRVRRAVMSGDPASCILEAARNSHAGFIVMGKRGLGRLAGLLVGSVSQKVSALADCACITVP